MQKAPLTQRRVLVLRKVTRNTQQQVATPQKKTVTMRFSSIKKRIHPGRERDGLLNEIRKKTNLIVRTRNRQCFQPRRCLMEGSSEQEWCNCRDRMFDLELSICVMEQLLESVLGQLTPNYSKAVSVVMGQPGAAPPIPLHEAAERGDTVALVRALVRGEDPNARDLSGDSALHCAARCDEALSIELLLAAGAFPLPRDADGASPLSVAVCHGHQNTVEILLAKGAELEQRDKDGRTPLMRAVALRNTQMVLLLVHHGARVHVVDHHGMSPLVTAARDCSIDILTLLVCHSSPSMGQMVQAMNVAGSSAALMILVQEMHMSAGCSVRSGLLARVAKEGWLHPIRSILNNCQEHQCQHKFHYRHIRNAIMVAKTEDILLALWKGARGTTRGIAMNLAAAKGWATALEAFISHWKNVETSKTNHFFEIADALSNVKTPETASLLLEAHPHVARTSVGRETALRAAYRGWYKVLETLIDNGVPVDYKWNGSSLLHKAASRGNTECVQMLVSRGASVQERDDHGRTPLHWAAEAGHSLVVDILLKKGADPTAKDHSGRMPYKVATTEDTRTLLGPLQ